MRIAAWVFLLGCVWSSLYAQYDIKQIMLGQAQQLEARRQYERANTIYSDLAKKFPDDYTIADRWIQNLVRLSQFDRADSLLSARGAAFPLERFSGLRVLVDLKQGHATEAEKFVDQQLSQNSGRINLYTAIAGAYIQCSQYDKAVNVYLRGRKALKNDELFSGELASAYFYGRQYDLAVPEYVRLLAQQPGQYYGIASQMKFMLKEEPGKIDLIRKAVGDSNIPEIQQLLAVSLVQVGKLDEALNIYCQLPSDKLLAFSDEMFAAGNYDVALRGYTAVTPKLKDVAKAADLKIRVAKIHLACKRYDEAERLLLDVYRDSGIKTSSNLYRTRANQESCELLARICLIENRPETQVLGYLQDAQTYAYNSAERVQTAYETVHYLLMRQHFAEAKTQLDKLTKDLVQGSDVEASGIFYRYLYYALQDSAQADSLLGEIIIRKPQGDEVNDAIQLTRIKSILSPDAKPLFLAAYRDDQLFQTLAAITELDSAATHAKNEELLLLAGNWALDRGEWGKAREIFSRSFQDEDDAAYAKYQLARMENDPIVKQGMVMDYLSKNPGNVFSPSFRELLEGSGQ